MAAHTVTLPPEVWLCVFHHVAHVPSTLVPEIYAHASPKFYTKACSATLRETLVTTRALVRVCKQWWHLGIPYLYRSVYIGKVHCLSSLSGTLLRSAMGRGTVIGARPLGEYTERLDIAMRDLTEDADAEVDSLAMLITCMPHLAIVSLAVTKYAMSGASILRALQHSAASLRVLDWSSCQLQPPPSSFMDFIVKCTQLRILHCPRLVWSRELERGGIPPSLTTLRVHALKPVHMVTSHLSLPNSDPHTIRHSGPSALQELILDLHLNSLYWKDLLEVYSDQLVSIQLYSSSKCPIVVGNHMQLLTQTCPRLRRLTITSDQCTPFIHPDIVFPSIEYLGLRTTRMQSRKPDFERFFMFLEDLPSRVPSLQVVQLLNERNVQCLLKTHTKFAARALHSFWGGKQTRLEDSEGVLLTDRLKALGQP